MYLRSLESSQITLSLTLTGLNGTRRENLGFYCAGIDFNFSGIKSSNVQNSSVFLLFASFCSVRPHSLLIMGPHTGLKTPQI